jgi:hypothetical protein
MEPSWFADIPGCLSDIQDYVLEGTGSVADIQESILEGTGYISEAPDYISEVLIFRADAHGLRREVPQFKYLGLRCRFKVLVWLAAELHVIRIGLEVGGAGGKGRSAPGASTSLSGSVRRIAYASLSTAVDLKEEVTL